MYSVVFDGTMCHVLEIREWNELKNDPDCELIGHYKSWTEANQKAESENFEIYKHERHGYIPFTDEIDLTDYQR